MTIEGDQLHDLDQAVERIGALANAAWENGGGYAEVVEEVIFTVEEVAAVRQQLEAILPSTWLPDLPFQERLRKLVELRRAWLNCAAAQEGRIAELELMANDMGDPPLSVDPAALVSLRILLRGEPRAVVLTGRHIELLKGVFGETSGPTHIEPAIICPVCEGLGMYGVESTLVDCVRCDGHGKVPDVEGMRLRLAELEHENRGLRDIVDKTVHLMAWLNCPRHPPLAKLWLDVDMGLGAYRNSGYENSDHPDDFSAPTWSAADPEPKDVDV